MSEYFLWVTFPSYFYQRENVEGFFMCFAETPRSTAHDTGETAFEKLVYGKKKHDFGPNGFDSSMPTERERNL